MTVSPPESLKPRKTPRQARSAVTVNAISEATIQVLLLEGARRLTTTRVAERAGVSVGTMYQYFPHKQALLYAVLQQHLGTVAEAVEAACLHLKGQPVVSMVDGLVAAYVDAKTTRAEVSRALYLVAGELDTAELLGDISKRIHVATARLLASAPDAAVKPKDLQDVTFTLLAAMAGTTRAVFERGATRQMLRALRSQLTLMCQAYVQAAAAGLPPDEVALHRDHRLGAQRVGVGLDRHGKKQSFQ
jgi:AcrR family transcriptional regulator